MSNLNKDSNLRECIHINLQTTIYNHNVLNYTAGFIDSDGCFKVNKDNIIPFLFHYVKNLIDIFNVMLPLVMKCDLHFM